MISLRVNKGYYMILSKQMQWITGGPTPLVVAAGPGVPEGPSSPCTKLQIENEKKIENEKNLNIFRTAILSL
jgi:hypothetical protein